MPKEHIEVVMARKFYKRPTPGWCVLCNGRIVIHIHGRLDGKAAKTRAHEFARKIEG